MGKIQKMMDETDKIGLGIEPRRKPSNRELIENGLRTAEVQGDKRKVAFWRRSKEHLDQVEGGQ